MPHPASLPASGSGNGWLLAAVTLAIIAAVGWYAYRLVRENRWRPADQVLLGLGIALSLFLIVWEVLRLYGPPAGENAARGPGGSLTVRIAPDVRVQTRVLPEPLAGEERVLVWTRDAADGALLDGVLLGVTCAGRVYQPVRADEGFFYLFLPAACLTSGGLLKAEREGCATVRQRVDQAHRELVVVLECDLGTSPDRREENTAVNGAADQSQTFPPERDGLGNLAVPPTPEGFSRILVNVLDTEGRDLAEASVAAQCPDRIVGGSMLAAGVYYLFVPETCFGPGLGSVLAAKEGYTAARKPLLAPRESMNFVLAPRD